jgi:glutathione reductase (NADPH)
VATLVKASRQAGIQIIDNVEVREVRRSGPGLEVGLSDGQWVAADMVVHGAGRKPDLASMNLGTAGVDHERRGVVVDDYLASVSNPAVYAAGDAASLGLNQTPVASFHGDVAAENMLEGNHRRADPGPVPSVVFTIPPLAAVGLRPEQADRSGRKVRVESGDMAEWFTSRRVGHGHAGFKLVIDAASDEILGAHLLGVHAEETINVFGLAMRHGIKAGELKDFLWGYPTAASDIFHMV